MLLGLDVWCCFGRFNDDFFYYLPNNCRFHNNKEEIMRMVSNGTPNIKKKVETISVQQAFGYDMVNMIFILSTYKFNNDIHIVARLLYYCISTTYLFYRGKNLMSMWNFK